MKTVYRGVTKKGQKIIIRYPLLSDYLAVWRYFNVISSERTFFTFQGERISKKYITKWLDENIKKIHQKKCVILFVLIEGKLFGVSDIILKERVHKHVASFGISLVQEIRGQGVGKLLMSLVISEAQKKLTGLKIVTLQCYANNKIAMNLYRSLGFIKFGCLPGGIYRQDAYDNEIYMYKIVGI